MSAAANLTSAPAAPQSVTYQRVNEALNGIFFDGRFRLSPVYLDVEADICEELSSRLGLALPAVLDRVSAAVAGTLKWAVPNPYSWHLAELKAWNELGRFEPPPFTALLVALSLAAERMRGDAQYSSQNYYERLFEVLGVSDETRKNRIKQHAASTKPLWEALNRWLAENDFDFGRPTARPVNNWEYAGYAVSQALVRKADRERLHQCFAEYGLAPHERLTEAEMGQYLHDWMRGSQPSAWLKRVWASPDLRPRVAAAACAELEAWEGSDQEESDDLQRRRLSWAAALQSFPVPRLSMFLAAAGDEQDGIGGLRLAQNSSAAATAAFEGCPDDLWLTPSLHGALSILEPVKSIALSPLMLASFELISPAAGLRFSRAARPVVPLVKLDTGAYYREVSRASFLRPHLVLCHAEWRQRVSKLLGSVARPGFREWSPKDIQGLAEDWVLFSNVQILRRAETSDDHLAALTPLAEGVSIEFTGGLRLSQGIYHASAAPEITASSSSAKIALKLVDAEGSELKTRDMKSSVCRMDLASTESYGAANLTVQALTDGKVRSEIQLAFRSADAPKRLSERARRIVYCLDPELPQGALSARDDDAASSCTVSGLRVEGSSARSLDAAGTDPLPQDLQPSDEATTDGAGEYLLHKVEGLQEACILRGHHWWLVDELRAGDDPNAPIWKTCRDCRNRILTPGNRLRAAAYGKGKAHANGVKPGAGAPKMNPRVSSPVPPALIFDALCYLGDGSWRRFQDIVATEEASSLTAHSWAASLSGRGLLDLTLDERLRTPVGWSVPGPALVFASPRTAFLSGFRSQALVEEVASRLERAGASWSEVDQEGAPPAFLAADVDQQTSAAALSGLRDIHGRPVEVLDNPAAAIAAAHPGLPQLTATMRPLRLEQLKELHRFEPSTARWRASDKIEPGYAYRSDYAGRRYVYVFPDGRSQEGPHWMVKLLAARHEGVRLHGYDESRGKFQAVLGCDLPPLLHRALVSRSGLSPSKGEGRLSYSGVPPIEAAAVLARLYA